MPAEPPSPPKAAAQEVKEVEAPEGDIRRGGWILVLVGVVLVLLAVLLLLLF